MASPSSRQLLAQARELIAFSWTQHADARDADGVAVEPWAADAVSWSLLGALVVGYERLRTGDGEGGAFVALRRACVLLAAVLDSDSLPDWNDAPERTRADVLAALDEAERHPFP
jgi:hypothetical protein